MSSVRVEDLPEIVIVEELADVLRVGRSKAYELVNSGAIPRVAELGRIVRVRRADVERFIQREAGEAKPVSLRAVK